MNPAIQQLNAARFPQMFNEAKARVEALKSLGSPQSALQYLMQQNPNIRQAMQYVNQNGGNPKAVCEKLLRENGMI